MLRLQCRPNGSSYDYSYADTSRANSHPDSGMVPTHYDTNCLSDSGYHPHGRYAAQNRENTSSR
jgi:hypothetical protein